MTGDATMQLGALNVRRLGFGTMQLTGPGVWGPPSDHDRAVATAEVAVRRLRSLLSELGEVPALPHDLAKAAAWNSFSKSAGLKDDGLDVATANLSPDERRRFTKMVHELAGF